MKKLLSVVTLLFIIQSCSKETPEVYVYTTQEKAQMISDSIKELEVVKFLDSLEKHDEDKYYILSQEIDRRNAELDYNSRDPN